MWTSKLLTVAFSILALLCSNHTVLAAAAYPIPFDDKPDWQGFASRVPADEAGIVRATQVMKHMVLLITITVSEVDNSKAAGIAYKVLFSNTTRIPAGPLYAVVVIYGPPNSLGLYPDYAFVFRRDSGSNHWLPRRVTRKELIAVECAIGRCPNY